MKFSAGYNPFYSFNVESIADVICKYDDIIEVFFPFPYEISGRPPVSLIKNGKDFTVDVFINDLSILKKNGKKLNLLLNGNCYGEFAISNSLKNKVDGMLKFLSLYNCYPDIITTTSIHIAKHIKEKYSNIKLRASVTFDVHELQGMNYLANVFDGYYLSLTKQRDIEFVKKVNNWCNKNEKELCLLPNSSCLGNCPYIAYHANIVAHSAKSDTMSFDDMVPCYHIWKSKKMVESLHGVWIRPEDIKNYEGLCSIMKLTTRMHLNPKLVFDAYTTGKYNGNLLKILDPYYDVFDKFNIDNSKFPSTWFDKTSHCNHDCCNCKYCETVLS